jgi:hypothetical protein
VVVTGHFWSAIAGLAWLIHADATVLYVVALGDFGTTGLGPHGQGYKDMTPAHAERCKAISGIRFCPRNQKPAHLGMLPWMPWLWPSLLGLSRVVQPDTILRWHRAGFGAYWRWKSRAQSGRPPPMLLARADEVIE